jgi:hypothetical protein
VSQVGLSVATFFGPKCRCGNPYQARCQSRLSSGPPQRQSCAGSRTNRRFEAGSTVEVADSRQAPSECARSPPTGSLIRQEATNPRRRGRKRDQTMSAAPDGDNEWRLDFESERTPQRRSIFFSATERLHSYLGSIPRLETRDLSEPKASLDQLQCAVLLFAAFAVLWIPLLPLAAWLDLSLCLCTACKLAPPQSRHSFVLVQDWSATIQN